MSTPKARAEKFAMFITDILTTMRADGMTIADVVKATGVSKTTLHRWTTGDWTTEPRANQVWDFCTGLGVPPAEAAQLLGWTSEPMSELDAPLRQIQLGLANPGVGDDRKRAVRDLLRVAGDLLAGATAGAA